MFTIIAKCKKFFIKKNKKKIYEIIQEQIDELKQRNEYFKNKIEIEKKLTEDNFSNMQNQINEIKNQIEKTLKYNNIKKKIIHIDFKDKHLEEGYIYLIQEREFIKTQENIFKIGKTIDYRKRIASYPNDSKLYFLYFTKYLSDTERYFIDKFKDNFIQRKDIGTEYFEGSYDEMSKFFLELCKV